MLLEAISFLVGCCGIYFFSTVPNLFILLTIIIVLLVASGRYKTKWLYFVVIVALGFFWVMWMANQHIHHRMPDVFEGKKIQVIGTVQSLPEGDLRHVSFLFKTEKVEGKRYVMTVKLGWYGHYPRLEPGQVWLFSVRLKKPHSYLNPGSFDYEAWLFLREIQATGYVVEAWPNRLISFQYHDFPVQRLRQKIRDRVNQLFPGQACAGFLTALIMGSRESLTLEQWRVLRQTGTNHLMAIAGLHVGLLAGLVFALSRVLWSRFPFLCLRYPAPQAAACFSFISAIFYSLLAGFSLQTERAIVMLGAGLFAVLLKRKIFSWTGWSLALLIVLVLNPLEVLNESFWMSFVTVASIIFCLQGRLRGNHWFDHYVRIQYVIMIGVFPLTLIFYHEVAWISFVANGFAVPWFALVIIPCCFLGGVLFLFNQTLAQGLWWIALLNLKGFWFVLTVLDRLSIAHGPIPFPEASTFIFMTVGVFFMLLPRGFPIRHLAFFCFLPLFFQAPKHPKTGAVWFYLLDVGQGLASVLQTENHVLVYDTGPSFAPELDASNSVTIPFLEEKNIQRIDRVVVSHGDNDHIGGLKTLLANVPVSSVLTSAPNQVDPIFHSVTACYRGQHWQWDGVGFQILSPEKDAPYGGNDSSCVLKVSTKNAGILLTGDIEKEQEAVLLAHQKASLMSTVLVAPHHGSSTSSSEAFVEAVHPSYALFPTGYLNRFHFPSSLVENRYARQGIFYFNTAYSGMISVIFDSNASIPKVELYREAHRKIWRS